MKKKWVFLSFLILALMFFQIFFSYNVYAGKAGVGVLNVAPQYNVIRLVKQDNNFRVYLTVSDYNSWEDFQSVSIILEENGGKKAEFLFKQYEDNSSYEKVNEFEEILPGNDLLITKKCSYDTSTGDDVEDKCNIELLFVFQIIWFSRINVIATDRSGSVATIQLDYSANDLIREGNILIIPGLGSSSVIDLPPYSLDIIALLIALFGTWYLARKSDIRKIMSAIYEKV